MKRIKLFIFTIFIIIGVFSLESSARAATLSLEPTSGTLAVGQSYNLMIYVNAGGDNVNAIDTIINYDSSYVTIQSLTSGSILSSYPTKTFNSSTITISGNAGMGGTPYTGSHGLFATINFRVLKTGTSAFTFDFTSGSTTDSNVIGDVPAVDVLTTVTNSSFTYVNVTTTPSSLPKTALTDKDSVLGLLAGFILIASGLMIWHAVKASRTQILTRVSI